MTAAVAFGLALLGLALGLALGLGLLLGLSLGLAVGLALGLPVGAAVVVGLEDGLMLGARVGTTTMHRGGLGTLQFASTAEFVALVYVPFAHMMRVVPLQKEPIGQSPHVIAHEEFETSEISQSQSVNSSYWPAGQAAAASPQTASSTRTRFSLLMLEAGVRHFRR